MQNFFSQSVSQTLSSLQTSAVGLSENDAEQRLKKYGQNQLVQKNKGGVLKLFLSQFADIMVIMLVAAAVVSGVLSYLSKDTHELFDTIIIVFIIFVNAIVGFIQQYRAYVALVANWTVIVLAVISCIKLLIDANFRKLVKNFKNL